MKSLLTLKFDEKKYIFSFNKKYWNYQRLPFLHCTCIIVRLSVAPFWIGLLEGCEVYIAQRPNLIIFNLN